MDLRCRKTNCKFNKRLTCTAPKISITEDLKCMEYQSEKGKGEKDFSKQIFTDTPPKISDYNHIKNTCLNCNANCLFNRDSKCISNGITINTFPTYAKCITFLKP